MEKAVSVSDAKRRFWQLLREVRAGQSYLVTSRRRPVARLTPVPAQLARSSNALSSLLRRLRSQKVTAIGRWNKN